jgi:hypothetical protein
VCGFAGRHSNITKFVFGTSLDNLDESCFSHFLCFHSDIVIHPSLVEDGMGDVHFLLNVVKNVTIRILKIDWNECVLHVVVLSCSISIIPKPKEEVNGKNTLSKIFHDLLL